MSARHTTPRSAVGAWCQPAASISNCAYEVRIRGSLMLLVLLVLLLQRRTQGVGLGSR